MPDKCELDDVAHRLLFWLETNDPEIDRSGPLVAKLRKSPRFFKWWNYCDAEGYVREHGSAYQD